MNIREASLQKHYEWKGKIEVDLPCAGEQPGGAVPGLYAGRGGALPGDCQKDPWTSAMS